MGNPSPTRDRATQQIALLIAALLAMLGMLSGPLAGVADAAGEQVDKVVTGTLINSADGSPVEGAEISVTTPGGEEFTGATDAEGHFEIKVKTEPGPLTIKLDEDSLPEGVTLREGARAENVVNSSLQTVTTTFPIGPDTRNVETKWDRIPGLVYSGLLFGLIIAMAALGLSVVFGTTGLTNFAHGELVTFGALTTYAANSWLGLPFVAAVALTVVLALGFGWLQEKALWGPLRHRGTGLIAMMIVTIGLQFFLRNVYQFLTEGRLLNYREFLTPTGHAVGTLFTYTNRDIVVAAVSIAVLVGVILALSYTRLGRATRAVADNPGLASATGINVDRIITIVWVIGTALAALAGSFLAFQLGVTFQMGQLVLLLLFAAVTVGGLGSIWGALVGSLIIGVLIDLSTLVIPPDLKNAGALFLLIIILLFRPQGLLGRRERIG